MKVLCILNKPLAEDSRAQREISSLARRGHIVHVITYRQSLAPPELHPNIRIYSVPVTRRRGSKLAYAAEYSLYLVCCALFAFCLHLVFGYGVVQVFIMPECLVLASLAPKLLGARLVTDWMDPALEVYGSKYHSSRWDLVPVILQALERFVLYCSDAVIVPNLGFTRAFEARGMAPKRFTTIVNAADPSIFRRSSTAKNGSTPFTLLFHGDISRRNGLDVAIEATLLAARSIPNLLLLIAGEGPDLTWIQRRYFGGAIPSAIRFVGWQRLENVAALIRSCHLGVISNRDTPFTRINVPQRIFEYGAVGRPIVCASLPGIRDYFDDSNVTFFEPGDPLDLSKCIVHLYEHPRERLAQAEELARRCDSLSWDKFERVYWDVLEHLA